MGKNRYSRKKRKKRLVTKSQIFLFLICGLILSSMILSFVSSNADHRDNQNYTIEGIFHNPKVSAIQDIDILTPENDTYKAPMRGYYPGTYGFESIENGEEPNDWNFMGNGGKVIENEDFHNKVVELRIDGTNNLVGINQTLPEKTKGTIEFWIKNTDNTKTVWIDIQDDNSSNRITMLLHDREIVCQQFWTKICSYESDIWYHLSIEYDCSTNYNVSVNGVKFGTYDFSGSPVSMNKIIIRSNTYPRDYSVYLDAIGYSWDPNYNVGDNYKEGLYLSYENHTKFDWMGYSLNGEANTTISANTTIPFPTNKIHNTIQIFGNESSGIWHESELRHFTTISPIYIITPENKTYREPMTGYYPATYGFDNDGINDHPKGWIIDDSDGTIRVIGSIDDHINVIEMCGTNPNNAISVKNNFTERTSGTIEFWVRSTDINKPFSVLIHDSEALVSVYFVIKDGKFQYFTGSQPIGEYRTIGDIDNNTWYHVKIEFDIFDWHLWINDISQDNGIGYGFWGENPSDFDKVSFTQLDGNGEYLAYIDAVGFSWDPGYKIGDNLNEGLLLRYENSTILDWTGCSIDGGTNITISGSTIIPLRSEGLHTIQLFGNDTQGVWHFSNLRYFTYNSTLQADMIHVLDYINEDGLYFELLLNAPGSFNYSKSDSCFPSIEPMPNAIHYYWFRVFDYKQVENDLILEQITIRFSFDPQDIADPSLLALYRYDEANSEWEQIDIFVNSYFYFFEITLNDLSYFCLVENPVLPPQSIPIDIIIMILCIVVVAMLSTYIILSKKKNKTPAKVVKTTDNDISPSEPRVVFCPYCGHVMDSMSTFCVKCGARVEKGDENIPILSEPSSQQGQTLQAPIDQELISEKSVEVEPEQVMNKQEESIQKNEIHKKAPKKKKIVSEQKRSEKSIEELREIEKTEREIYIQEMEVLCHVHKGPLLGINYRCPKCRTMYCLKCASVLKENGEGCWVCNNPIKIETQLIKAEKFQEDIQDPISQNKLREIFRENNAIERLRSISNLNIALLSKDFLEKIDQFEWTLEEKSQFIKEMIGLSQKEREDILNQINQYKNTNE